MGLNSTFDKAVSLFCLGTVVILVLFMLLQVFFGFAGFVIEVNSIVTSGEIPQKLLISKSTELLHAIAIIVILVKAYKILMSYVETHHLSIKFLVEINIIASSLELLFNGEMYSLSMRISLLILGLASLLIYVIFYARLQSADEEYRSHRERVAFGLKSRHQPSQSKSHSNYQENQHHTHDHTTHEHHHH